jgi:hypothetical protein
MMRRLLTVAALSLSAAASAQAQVVGKLPAEAIMKDLEDGQRFGFFAGWLTTGLDPVGVRGKSAPIVGLRYDVLMSSPAYFSMRLFGVKSTHDVYDPNRPEGSRHVGTAPTNQMGLEASMDISLTGARSWRGLQPLVHGGIGFIAGVGNQFDAGQFATGASVLYSYGLATRFTTSKNSELRADVSWLIYQVRYPEAFKTTTAADNAPLRGEGSLTPFTTNRAMTLSYSWRIFR